MAKSKNEGKIIISILIAIFAVWFFQGGAPLFEMNSTSLAIAGFITVVITLVVQENTKNPFVGFIAGLLVYIVTLNTLIAPI